jgi:hypothetical protein
MSACRLSVACLVALVAAARDLPAVAAEIVELNAFPSQVVLSGARDRQPVIVQVRLSDGSTQDVTAEVDFAVDDASLVAATDGVLKPLTDGATQLRIAYAGQNIAVPVEVQGSHEDSPLNFRNDILPIFTKVGCNTGKCHGAASGKDGFRLSLFGYDPEGDHYRLTREIGGRRIDLASPESCLLVSKSTGEVDHTGGQRIVPETYEYDMLLSWLRAGAPFGTAEAPHPVRIEVFPPRAAFARAGEKQRITVIAHYSDGTDRDVTHLAVFLSNNDAAATVADDGVATSTGPGNAFILARFDQFTEGASLVVRPGTPYEFPQIASENYVDDLVFAKWQDMHLLPSGVCSDEVFLRRASIDLIGLLPTPEERQAFVVDSSPDKRSRLIDQLLDREEFLDIWSMKWAEMLQIRSTNGISPKGLRLYDQWLRERVHAGVTIDKIIAELLPANGGTFENPATSYYQTETTPQLLAENVAQAFLGTRIQCAQCHNHPFDRWTMDDYYGFAAFFSQVGYKQAQDPREITIFNAGTGELAHPIAGRPITLKALGGDVPRLDPGEDHRHALAEWLTSPENAKFPRHLSNLVWAHLFGAGIVEPVDDVRVSNPPSNPELLQALGEKLVEYQFDIRPLVRDICNSRTYQLATTRNDSNAWDERNFSHSRIRRLRAEVLLDCINQVTESTDAFRGLPEGSRAVLIPDGQTPNYFLSTFGRSDRATPCTCEVAKTSPTLSQALHLLNGETTSGKIAEGQVVKTLLASDADPMSVARSLYERCLCRLPTPEEASAIQKRLSASKDLESSLFDLFWALLNSNEFVFNH